MCFDGNSPKGHWIRDGLGHQTRSGSDGSVVSYERGEPRTQGCKSLKRTDKDESKKLSRRSIEGMEVEYLTGSRVRANDRGRLM